MYVNESLGLLFFFFDDLGWEEVPFIKWLCRFPREGDLVQYYFGVRGKRRDCLIIAVSGVLEECEWSGVCDWIQREHWLLNGRGYSGAHLQRIGEEKIKSMELCQKKKDTEIWANPLMNKSRRLLIYKYRATIIIASNFYTSSKKMSEIQRSTRRRKLQE